MPSDWSRGTSTTATNTFRISMPTYAPPRYVSMEQPDMPEPEDSEAGCDCPLCRSEPVEWKVKEAEVPCDCSPMCNKCIRKARESISF